MKSFKALMVIFIVIACVLSGISFMEFKRFLAYKKEFTEGQKKLSEVKKIRKQSEQIEEEIQSLQEEEILMEAKLTNNFESPLPLIRIFACLAREAGLAGASFEFIDKNKKINEQAKDKPEETVRLGEKLKNRESESGQSVTRVKPMFFLMECTGEYSQLRYFVENLLKQELIVTVEKVRITRDDEFSPRQKIEMTLATYTCR